MKSLFLLLALFSSESDAAADCPHETELRNVRTVAEEASNRAGDLYRYDALFSLVWIEQGALHIRKETDCDSAFVALYGEPWLISQTADHFCELDGDADEFPIHLAEYHIRQSQCPQLTAAVSMVQDMLLREFNMAEALDLGRSKSDYKRTLITVDGPAYRVKFRTPSALVDLYYVHPPLADAIGEAFHRLNECRDGKEPDRWVENDF